MPNTVETEVAQRLRMVIGRLARLLRPTDAGAAADLTPTRVAVLLTTVNRGPIGLSEIAEQENLNPTLLSRTVATLTEMGLVVRVTDPQDRRAARLEATPAGEKVAEQIRLQRTRAVKQALLEIAPQDRDLVTAALPALERLAAHLRGTDSQ